MPPPISSCDHSLCPILLGASLHSPLTAVGSILQPHLQSCKTDTDIGHRRDLGDHVVVYWWELKENSDVENWPLWITLPDFCGKNIPTMANLKPPMCHHRTWSKKGHTRFFSGAYRTSSRDTTEDRPSETLDAALPVDVPKATRAQLLHLSYSSWPRIQGGILPLLPCP